MENRFFNEIRGNFGFGCMRLPMKDGEVDLEEMRKMTDEFISRGFNYFDTAHGYIGGKSETAIRECVSKRYPREKFLLTNKLSTSFFNTEEEILPYFEEQLKACGVEYFDFYLMHAQDAGSFAKYKRCRAYETAFKLKEEGRVRHVGLSFHDKASVLEQILTEYPQIEIVQIQFNYVDYENPSVESRKCYEICEKFGKPVIVMEPVKGGSLVNLPEKAQKIIDDLQKEKEVKMSNASYAIRFAASFPGMCMVLSGMSDLAQMKDNISFMQDFKPLDAEEIKALTEVRNVFYSLGMIPCTSCHYCVLDNKCPRNISIPEMISCFNRKAVFNSWNENQYYRSVLTKEGGKASECIKCGKCEKICPQHLPIRSILQDIAKEFEHS